MVARSIDTGDHYRAVNNINLSLVPPFKTPLRDLFPFYFPESCSVGVNLP